jgi:mono/diheme cytochrome c family protein
MERGNAWIVALWIGGIGAVGAGTVDAQAAFQRQCAMCHTTKGTLSPKEKETLMGPPIDEVLYHVKERYPIRTDAVKFMADYIRHPQVEKALCPSMDKFGLMPSMAKTVSAEEAQAISAMLFDTYPRKSFARQERRQRSEVRFADLDANGDGSVSPREFREFRARRNGLDPRSFKADLFFKKIDRNGDGRLSPQEFEALRQAARSER